MNELYNRPTKLLYRDMIRLVKTLMEERKRVAVLAMIRKEFEKNKNLKEESEILELKKNACKAIGDLYLIYIKNSIKNNPDNPNNPNNTNNYL
jgi:hypothetical protein